MFRDTGHNPVRAFFVDGVIDTQSLEAHAGLRPRSVQVSYDDVMAAVRSVPPLPPS